MSLITDRSEGRDTLKDEIERIETVNNGITKPRLPQTKLDEISYKPESDSTLRAMAQSELDEYRRMGEQALYDEREQNEKTFAAQRDAYGKAKDDELAALSDRYDAAVRNADNDAIKRGLARSSVAAVTRGEIESEYLKHNTEIASTYGKKISEIESEISALDRKLRTALDDFNLTYATKLNARIRELKAEREKKIESVTKYNNEVREKQAKLEQDRLKAEGAIYGQNLQNRLTETSLHELSPEERDKIYKSVYDAMDKYLSSLDSAAARIELLNHTLYREHLSEYYYAKLFDKYGRVAPRD